jgi:hypothetical protein
MITDKEIFLIPYIIEENEGGTFAIIENPTSEVHGNCAWLGAKVVRSPYKTKEEARKRMEEIAKHFDYCSVEVVIVM